MNTEETRQPDKNFVSSALPSILIAGGIFSLASFVLNIAFGYQQISSEPTGAVFSVSMLSGVVICLITCLAGALAIWHYSKEVTPFITLGQGALTGFLTGITIVLISVVLNQLWALIDPEYTEKLIEATIANVEAMDLPSNTRQDMIDGMVEGVESSQSVSTQIFWGIPITGLFNLISGMIGAKIFGQKEEEF